MAHILVLNRMTPDVVSYGDYVDHDEHRVSYLTTPETVAAVAPIARRHGYELRVLDLRDEAAAHAAVDDVVRAVGEIDRVVALSEIDVLLAAQMREALGVPGQDLAEARLVRNKVLMKRRMAAAGVRVASFVSCADGAAVDELVRAHGFPLVLKPLLGYASIGVETVASSEELGAMLLRIERGSCILEEYVDAPLYHIDGLAIGGEVTWVKPTRYLNTPLSFTRGGPLGGWAIDDREVVASAARLAQTTCDELGIEGPFHLEAFRRDGELDWVFSEVAARAGGGPITRMVSHAYGVDLLATHAALQAGLVTRIRRNGRRPHDEVVAGYLCYPEPLEKPVRVVSAPSMKARIPEIYSETIPLPGEILDGTRHYLNIAVEFLYEAPTTALLRAAIERTLAEFRLEHEPVER